MRTHAQQRHAALCRHAKHSEAKHLYWQALSERLKTSPSASDLFRFASSERAAISKRVSHLQDLFSLQIKHSTMRTWLREWKVTQHYVYYRGVNSNSQVHSTSYTNQ